MERQVSYAVRYEGANHDDAKFRFELDRRRHKLNGYVPTDTEWIKHGWSLSSVLGQYWKGWLDNLPGRRLPLRWWMGAPETLIVTYTAEEAVPDE